MPGNYSLVTTVSTGGTILASDRNTEHQNHINNMTPAGVDDYSANASQMQSVADPYPAAAESQATALSGELERLRYVIKQITGKSQWYVDAAAIGSKGSDVASASSLTLGTDGNFFDITGTTAITSIATLGVGSVVRLQFDSSLVLTHHSTDLVLPFGKNIRTKTGDVATLVEYASGDWFLTDYSRGLAGDIANYRRPTLVYASATTVDVENNTGTSNQTRIIFPDGDMREVTEDTSSTNKYRRFDITADAEFTSGTEDSGLRAALTEATNTWYAIYAVKSAINTANFVLVGDTTFPLQANFSTLNTAYGTNGWVHLGYIRNGDNSGATGDILSFVQSGAYTVFSNVASYGGTGDSGVGTVLASATNGASSWTYSAGSGATDIPGTIKVCAFGAAKDADSGSNPFRVQNQAGTATYLRVATQSESMQMTGMVSAAAGVSATSGGANDETAVALVGFVDSVLGVGGNPVL